MALGKMYFLIFTALVAVNIIFAEDVTEVESRAGEQPRPFESLFPIITSCNSTVNPGTYCASCTQVLRCLPGGTGVLRNCRGLFPYCFAGRCSFLYDSIVCNRTESG